MKNKVISLLKKEKYDHTFSYSVAEEIISGEVYVDEKRVPHTAFVKIPNGIHHVLGTAHNQKFNEKLRSWMQAELDDRNKPFVLFSNPEWGNVIQDWGIPFERKERLTFNFDKDVILENGKSAIADKRYPIQSVQDEQIDVSPHYPARFYEIYWGTKEFF